GRTGAAAKATGRDRRRLRAAARIRPRRARAHRAAAHAAPRALQRVAGTPLAGSDLPDQLPLVRHQRLLAGPGADARGAAGADGRAAAGGLGARQRSVFSSTPMPSTSRRTTSPRLRYFGGLKPMPTPTGVPVAITSPG